MRTEERRRFGAWMRWAAREAGLTAPEIVRSLDLASPETVYRWWSGDRTPRSPNLRTYARLVGKDAGWFYQEGWPPEIPVAEMEGQAYVANEMLAIVPHEDAALNGQQRSLQTDVSQIAGRDWARMSDEERREILRELAEVAYVRRLLRVGSGTPTPR